MTKISSDSAEYKARTTMSALSFNNERRREWFIWAAKFTRCPTCPSPAFTACLNLAKLKRDETVPTRWPHDDRIDWDRMVRGLKERGYITGG